MLEKFTNLKQKILKLQHYTYCIIFRKHFNRKLLGNWTVGNMKKTRSNGYVYEFSVHYDAIAVDYIVGIHKDLMKKNNMV